MNAKEFTEIFEDLGFDFDIVPYSGRGMFGAKCPSFTIPDDELIETIVSITNAINDDNDSVESKDEFLRILKKAKTDGMGRDDIIVYFPRREYDK